MSKMDYVPTSYADLYAYYFAVKNGRSLVGTLIKGLMKHATPDEFEVLAQDTFTRMMEHKILEKFDASKANFGGAVYFTTRSVCVNYLDRKGRDPIGALNAGTVVESREDGEFERGVYALDSMDEGQDLEGSREATDFLGKLAAKLEALAKNPANTRDRNLIKVLELLAKEKTPSEIAEELGVTKTTVANWTAYIQQLAKQLV